jgi:hypothetical protein
MLKLLVTFVPCLVSGSLLAAVNDTGAAAPVESVSVIWVVVFVVVFFASIIGFLLYLWMSDRKDKLEK